MTEFNHMNCKLSILIYLLLEFWQCVSLKKFVPIISYLIFQNFTCPFMCNFFIGVQLVYNAVLVSGTQQSEYIYIYPLFFRVFSHVAYYRVLSRVSCAIQ